MVYEVVKGDLVIGKVKIVEGHVVDANLGRSFMQMFLPEGVKSLNNLKQWVSKRLELSSRNLSEFFQHKEIQGLSNEDNYWLRLKGSSVRWIQVASLK